MLSSLATAAGLSRTKKKFHFDVKIKLEELQNCTYLTGDIFAKVRLRDGGTYSALSKSCDVRSHIVRWGQDFGFHSKMYASPVTGELEPCQCKISVRKETKGGKSYKKLGYVKINLSEYAGAGETQKKYLLESYNEYKHKPDNSILQVTITLKQTSGDSLFKVPRATGQEWEFIENPTDEGIQPDIHSGQIRHSFPSNPPVSSSLGTFNLGGVAAGNGGSLQDVRRHKDKENGDMLIRDRKTSSASNLRGPDATTGSIREESGNSEEVLEESTVEQLHQPVAPSFLAAQKTNRSSSFNHGGSVSTDLPPSGLAQHRRMGSWSQVGVSHTSPHTTKHKRQQSLVSGQSSKSTSAYSTLSERSGGSVEGGGDGESMSGSLGRKLTLLATSSRMEQSRVDPQDVINNLFLGRNFESTITEQEGSEEGLKIYVDKNSGIITLAGPNLDRKNSNLQAIDVSQHKSSSSPRRSRMKSTSHANRDSTGPSSSHEQSPTPPQQLGATAPHSSSRSTSPSSTTSTVTAATR